jgi:Holliday junction resolvasome RuvABC endonuclease subunit
MTRRVLGIDPGVHGGLAVVELNDGAAARLVDAIDVPTVGVKAKERVDILCVRDWVQTHQPHHAVIERAQAMPKKAPRAASSMAAPSVHSRLRSRSAGSR